MTALGDFESGVVEVRLLLGLKEASLAGESLTSEHFNAVYRACVVLLVSHFESYLKSTAETFIDCIGDGTLESKRIPIGVRELHTVPKLAEITESGSPTQRHALLKKLHAVTALWADEAKPSNGTLKPEVLSRVVTNADSATIDKLFTLMGLPTAVCDGDLDLVKDGETNPVDIRLSLRDVVKCRNDIAHGDADRLPTDEDVVRYIEFLSALAQRLERKGAALIEQVLPT